MSARDPFRADAETAADHAAELADMREHVPYLQARLDAARDALAASESASLSVYGPRKHWPAGSEMRLRDLEASVAEAEGRLAEAQAYLGELEAAA